VAVTKRGIKINFKGYDLDNVSKMLSSGDRPLRDFEMTEPASFMKRGLHNRPANTAEGRDLVDGQMHTPWRFISPATMQRKVRCPCRAGRFHPSAQAMATLILPVRMGTGRNAARTAYADIPRTAMLGKAENWRTRHDSNV
jgi:hypothetical protein